MDMAELNNDWEWRRARTISNFALAGTTAGGSYWTKWYHTNEPNDVTTHMLQSYSLAYFFLGWTWHSSTKNKIRDIFREQWAITPQVCPL